MRRILSLLLCLLALSACASGGGAGVVNTNGSTSMERVVGALIEAYGMEHTGVTINYSGTGSSAGIQGVLEGMCDIGLSSRALRPEEEDQGARARLLALDALAVLVHPDNPVETLRVEELAALASGQVSDWAQVGGVQAPVAFIGREAGSGTRTAFEEVLGLEGACAYTNELTSTGDVIANVSSNPNAIGYASLAAVGEGVKVLAIDGVRPSEEAIQAGAYPICRSFYLVTAGEEGLSPAARDFLDYAQGPGAEPYLRAAGAVPPARSASGREGYP